MAKQIVAWCDPHMTNDEQVPGRSFVLAINDGKPVEIDLCEQHEKELLTPLQHLLDEVGQPVAPEPKAVGTGGPKKKCSMCEKELTREGLRKHFMTQHGLERRPAGDAVREIFGASSNGTVEARPCPDCGTVFDTPQGLGVHRRIKHGYAKGDDDS